VTDFYTGLEKQMNCPQV